MATPPLRLRWARRGLPALLLAAACGGAGEPAPRVEHVVLFLVDTLRADHLGAHGYARETSPRLDALAAQGALFTNAVSQSSWTAPSVVSMVTGRYVAEDRLRVPEDLASLSEAFQAAGWSTAAFVSNPLISEENGFWRGFDVVRPLEPHGGDDPLVGWLERRAGERTFTYVHLVEPHDPYRPPPQAHRWLSDTEGAIAPEVRAHYEDATARLELVEPEASVERIAKEIGGYDDEIRWVDRRIGGILDVLERTGVAERSAVVVTSDHGEGLWTREAFPWGQRKKAMDAGEAPTLVNTFMARHGLQVFRELVHVPLILRAPGVAPGQVFDGLVEVVDVAPTLYELAGVAPPHELHGRSLLEWLGPGAADAGKDYAFTHTRFNSGLLTADGWQLIVPTPLGECQLGEGVQLYDLGSDPAARHDVADAHPERVAELLAVVERRLAAGIAGEGLSGAEEARDALEALGYLDAGLVDAPGSAPEAAGEDTDALVERAAADPDCLRRLDAARRLAGRELTPEQVARLEEAWPREGSDAVRAALAPLLDRAGG